MEPPSNIIFYNKSGKTNFDTNVYYMGPAEFTCGLCQGPWKEEEGSTWNICKACNRAIALDERENTQKCVECGRKYMFQRNEDGAYKHMTCPCGDEEEESILSAVRE